MQMKLSRLSVLINPSNLIQNRPYCKYITYLTRKRRTSQWQSKISHSWLVPTAQSSWRHFVSIIETTPPIILVHCSKMATETTRLGQEIPTNSRTKQVTNNITATFKSKKLSQKVTATKSFEKILDTMGIFIFIVLNEVKLF